MYIYVLKIDVFLFVYREILYILLVGGLERIFEGGIEELGVGLDLGGIENFLLFCWGEG